MTTPTAPRQQSPRPPRLDFEVAMGLAAREYGRFVEVVEDLSPDDWAARTDCPDWTVRDVAGHLLGSMRMAASLREQYSQVRAARARGGDLTDALSAEQVHRCRGLSAEELVTALSATAHRAVRGRRRTPGLVRRRALPAPVAVGGRTEAWTLGYLIDVVLTRDTWMHRIDVCRATGRAVRLSSDHDGVIVADLVQEWSERHGEPYRLVLTGPAGGSWGRGDDAAQLVLDAVEFARIVSGRGHAEGLLSTAVPF